MAYLPLLLLLSACTTPSVRDTSAIDAPAAQCESVDCVVTLMDTLPQEIQDARFPFMEGQPDTRLAELKQRGQLRIEILNPLWLIPGVYGYAYIEPKRYGGVKSCDVAYLPGFNWLSLKHELSHCQGYADHGIPLQIADYTDEQKTIMAKEHASKWIDTRFYQTGMAR